jgi:MoxR-like ATPase
LGQQWDLYIINGHQELGPEDIACSATMTSSQTIEYVASPLFAAMLRGGICFFDEIGKAPTSALDPLASALDDRRTLTSVLAGIHLKAQDDFLFCAALNEDEEEALGLPEFIDERTRPAIRVGHPPPEVMDRILRAHLKTAADKWFEVFLKHFNKGLSPRGAITLLSYAYRLSLLAGNPKPGERQIRDYLKRARDEVKVDHHETEGS